MALNRTGRRHIAFLSVASQHWQPSGWAGHDDGRSKFLSLMLLQNGGIFKLSNVERTPTKFLFVDISGQFESQKIAKNTLDASDITLRRHFKISTSCMVDQIAQTLLLRCFTA